MNMNKIITIAKKEWQNNFSNPVGYVFAALLLLVVNWMFYNDFFLVGQANIQPYFSTMAYLFSIFIPAITMGLIADEKKNGNWEIILSMPVNEIQLVVGKILGCGLYILFTIALSLPTAATMYFLGKPDSGVMGGSYLGIIILGWSYLAVGVFMSSLSSQAIVGFLGSAVFLILDNLIGQEVLLTRLPGVIRGVVESLSLAARVGKVESGLITLVDVIFFLSWMMVWTILTVLVLKNRDK